MVEKSDRRRHLLKRDIDEYLRRQRGLEVAPRGVEIFQRRHFARSHRPHPDFRRRELALDQGVDRRRRQIHLRIALVVADLFRPQQLAVRMRHQPFAIRFIGRRKMARVVGSKQRDPFFRVTDHLVDTLRAHVIDPIVEAMIPQVRRALGIEPQLGLDKLRDLRPECAIGRRRCVGKRRRRDRDNQGDRRDQSRREGSRRFHASTATCRRTTR